MKTTEKDLKSKIGTLETERDILIANLNYADGPQYYIDQERIEIINLELRDLGA